MLRKSGAKAAHLGGTSAKKTADGRTHYVISSQVLKTKELRDAVNTIIGLKGRFKGTGENTAKSNQAQALAESQHVTENTRDGKHAGNDVAAIIAAIVAALPKDKQHELLGRLMSIFE